MTSAAKVYVELPANDRQEFRLSSLLKAHLGEVAAARGVPVATYVVEILAERVACDLAEAGTWNLTMPEQARLLEILAKPPQPSPAMVEAMQRADELFGAMPTSG